MFTGIIEEIGAIAQQSASDMRILAHTVLEGTRLGDSIAVNGCCLTVTSLNDDGFSVQTSPESIARTTLAQLKPGEAVNLERAMAAGDRFGGHFVLGHVDGVGRVRSIERQGDFALWCFQAPEEVAKYLVPKGSIAVDGVSLTVVEPAGSTFGVAFIPATIEHTTLKNRRPGDAVNLEADMLGKHVYHYVNRPGENKSSIDMDFLARHGFA